MLAPSPLRRLRRDRGLTIRQVAEAAGVSDACVMALEAGRRRGRPRTLIAIVDALNELSLRRDLPPVDLTELNPWWHEEKSA